MKLIVSILACALTSFAALAEGEDWKKEIDRQVGLLGHRNMIIIADSAFPIQTGGGIKVIATGADHEAVAQARQVLHLEAHHLERLLVERSSGCCAVNMR